MVTGDEILTLGTWTSRRFILGVILATSFLVAIGWLSLDYKIPFAQLPIKYILDVLYVVGIYWIMKGKA